MCNFIVCVHLNSLAYIIYVLFYVGITSTSVISVDHYSLLRLSKCACHLLTNLKPEMQRRLVRSVWLHVCCLKCILFRTCFLSVADAVKHACCFSLPLSANHLGASGHHSHAACAGWGRHGTAGLCSSSSEGWGVTSLDLSNLDLITMEQFSSDS